MKVWIYKGDILPYKTSAEDKISREAAMAVGETSGQVRPRRVISAGGGRRRPDQPEPGAAPAEPGPSPSEEPGTTEEMAPVIREADPELERLLAEEEEIERRTRQPHETPHFRSDEE